MKLIRESIENVKYLTEKTEDGKKKLYIEGTFLVGDTVNKNNRMYKMDTLRNEVNRYTEEFINTNRALGELGHPDTPSINLERVSHKIVSLKEDGNTFYGKALILGTPYGQIVENFINNDIQVGVSSRALGSLTQTKEGYNLVQDDLKLATAADIVADPSAPEPVLAMPSPFPFERVPSGNIPRVCLFSKTRAAWRSAHSSFSPR